MPESYAEAENSRFLNSDSRESVRCLEAAVWHHDTTLAMYFIMLNPIFVVASYYSGLGIFAIDLAILIMLSQLMHMITHDDTRIEGEGLLLQVLSAEEMIGHQREADERRKKGQGTVIEKFIKHVLSKKKTY